MDKRCQNCNQPNPPEAAFCLNCAAPLSGRQPGTQQQQQANQQWNHPNFGGQPLGQNFAQPPPTAGGASKRATAALILAIAGLLCCGPFTSIPAAIVGWMEVDAIKKGQSSPGGMMFAQIGLWGGIAVTILQGIVLVLWILLSMAASNPYGY